MGRRNRCGCGVPTAASNDWRQSATSLRSTARAVSVAHFRSLSRQRPEPQWARLVRVLQPAIVARRFGRSRNQSRPIDLGAAHAKVGHAGGCAGASDGGVDAGCLGGGAIGDVETRVSAAPHRCGAGGAAQAAPPTPLPLGATRGGQYSELEWSFRQKAREHPSRPGGLFTYIMPPRARRGARNWLFSSAVRVEGWCKNWPDGVGRPSPAAPRAPR